jgi:hypothetical protein
MTEFSVLPSALSNRLVALALSAATSQEDLVLCAEAAMLLDAKPAVIPMDDPIHQDFALYAPLLELSDMSFDGQGRYVDARTQKAFEQYCEMKIRNEAGPLATKDKANGFFKGVGEVYSTLKPAPETLAGFERVFDLLTRLDPSMPLSQVMVWLREFISGTRDAQVALTAAEGRWVPIAEGLPPEDAFMLLTDANWPHAQKRGEPAPIKVGYREKDAWKIFGGSWTPTHFMLLPPPAVPVSVDGVTVEQAPWQAVPKGYCVMPRKLTAENGAKGLLSAEFSISQTHVCFECDAADDEPDADCGVCKGVGSYEQKTHVSWDLMKDIYKKAVSGLALGVEPEKPSLH